MGVKVAYRMILYNFSDTDQVIQTIEEPSYLHSFQSYPTSELLSFSPLNCTYSIRIVGVRTIYLGREISR
jgi:hypothetical protein